MMLFTQNENLGVLWETQEDKRSSGFGLGLYIVKTIVNLHKFSLDYEYVDGKNCFIIKLDVGK